MPLNIQSLLLPQAYDHATGTVVLVETHISWVLLAGDYAYKIKKPVDFGFLNFSTIALRKQYCEEELRLNRRLASSIYLDVVSLHGSLEKPTFRHEGTVIDYAVRMNRFDDDYQLDHMLQRGELQASHMDAIADTVAEFHAGLPAADEQDDFGNPDSVLQPAQENIEQIRAHLPPARLARHAASMAQIERWLQAEWTRLEPVFEQRKQDGFIREGHGDMHLRNLLWTDDHVIAFDCIEFNPSLRWIDVISEVAFLVMDLDARQHSELANRYLNHYLERSGDYAGISVMRFYLCYRAMVRAKVAALGIEQALGENHQDEAAEAELARYLDLAMTYTRSKQPGLLLMRGVSASGKSTISQQLVDRSGAIRLRSDVERKRLYGLDATTRANDDIDRGIYSEQASQRTYNRLLELAGSLLDSGYSVIIDAASLHQEQRSPFQQLAAEQDVEYRILEIVAPEAVLKQRISQRSGDASDANLAVLEHQLANWQPLTNEELAVGTRIDNSQRYDLDEVVRWLD